VHGTRFKKKKLVRRKRNYSCYYSVLVGRKERESVLHLASPAAGIISGDRSSAHLYGSAYHRG
jgi:hypothetical protein